MADSSPKDRDLRNDQVSAEEVRMWGRGSEYAHAVLSCTVRRVDNTTDGAISGGTNCCQRWTLLIDGRLLLQ